MHDRRNPFSTIIMILALIGIAAGVALIVLGALTSENLSSAQLAYVAIGFPTLGAGAALFLVWLVVSAITWAIGQSSERTVAAIEAEPRRVSSITG